jgi:hypothetical protein
MDTGMSRGVHDGKAVVLKITTGRTAKVVAVDATGTASDLWAEE